MKIVIIIILILIIPFPVLSKDLSNLYDQSTLQYWQTRYKPNIQYNFGNVILPVLTYEERLKLAGVQLRFPLFGKIGGDPLEFYSYIDNGIPIIDMPILSIKFFDDLAISYSWLWINGYTLETVTEYVSVLKYSKLEDFPGSHYPPPLKGLQIPVNALDDPEVDALSQKILKSAIVWILAHELAHIYYEHPGYGPHVSKLQAQRNEEEADRFATDIMRRIGVAPLGIANFLTVAVHWWSNRGDFISEEAWKYYIENATHPLSSQRLKKLSAQINTGAADFARKEPNYNAALEIVKTSAGEIYKLALLLEDENLQKSIRIKAHFLMQDPNLLAPRKP